MNTPFKMPDKANIQGLILRGYTHPFSCHLLFSFSGSTKVGVSPFFNDLYPKVQSAASWGKNKPASMLNIGLTFLGIQKLSCLNFEIIKQADLDNFPPSFRSGPWSYSSQQSLQDTADPKSVPNKWWNGNGDAVNKSLHCIVHTYGLTQADLDSLVDFVTASAQKNGFAEIIPLASTNGEGRLYQSIVDGDSRKIHFGYTDGISEPSLQNPGNSNPLPNQDSVNNFLIGYYNGSVSQPGPFDDSTASSFAKDGCYNAFRIIYQDVASFNKLLKDLVTEWGDTLSFLKLSAEELEEWFAAKLCGRWRNGSPLILSPQRPNDRETSARTSEDFGYAVLDTLPARTPNTTTLEDNVLSSFSCPFSAHTRVANPRNQNLTKIEGPNGPPKIIRRGMPYGVSLKTGTEDDGVDRGLIGLFLCGDFSTQFEKLYGWMNTNNFSDKPIFDTSCPPQDALLGNRVYGKENGLTTNFIIPVEGVLGNQIVIQGLPQFLTTRGTSYCLLPSMETLAKIAGI